MLHSLQRLIMEDSQSTQFSWAYLTDTGVKRTSNEDAALAMVLNLDAYRDQSFLGLFVVSDGMGGKERGELASKIAVKTIGEVFLNSFIRPSLLRVAEVVNYGSLSEESTGGIVVSPAQFLVESIQEANRRICHVKRGGNRINIGATITVGVVSDDLLTIGHVGDCRCYLHYDNNFRQLTRDHSMVNELVKQGIISPEEGKAHPQRNVLARALGSSDVVEVDTYVSVVSSGCKILLCTDGLYTMLSEDSIQAVMAQPKHPKELVQELVVRTNEAGAKDNVTAMVIQIL